MSTFVFAGFESLSEFITGLHGDCGPLALLLCLHVRDPQHYPLSKAGLSALVADMGKRGCLMRADGESNIPDLDKYLKLVGVPHVTVGYAAYTEGSLHQHLKALSSDDPRLVLVEWSAAGKGLHDDEANVQYHYSAFGGIDTAKGYYRGDGDSRTDDKSGKPTAPILTGWPEVLAAEPVGYIVIDVPAVLKPKPAKPAPASQSAPATTPPVAPPPAPAPVQATPTAQPAIAVAQQQDVEGTVMNIFKLFEAAAAHLSLSPAQRAVLRLVDGLVITALVAALPIVAQALGHQSINWAVVLQAAGGAAATAIGLALLKYARAHADPALT